MRTISPCARETALEASADCGKVEVAQYHGCVNCVLRSCGAAGAAVRLQEGESQVYDK